MQNTDTITTSNTGAAQLRAALARKQATLAARNDTRHDVAAENMGPAEAFEALQRGKPMSAILPETLALAAEQGRGEAAAKKLETAASAARYHGLLTADFDGTETTAILDNSQWPRTHWKDRNTAFASALWDFFDLDADDQLSLLFAKDNGADESFAVSIAEHRDSRAVKWYAVVAKAGEADMLWPDFAGALDDLSIVESCYGVSGYSLGDAGLLPDLAELFDDDESDGPALLNVWVQDESMEKAVEWFQRWLIKHPYASEEPEAYDAEELRYYLLDQLEAAIDNGYEPTGTHRETAIEESLIDA